MQSTILKGTKQFLLFLHTFSIIPKTDTILSVYNDSKNEIITRKSGSHENN